MNNKLIRLILCWLMLGTPLWADPSPPATPPPATGPVVGQPWTNSLGVKFVSAGTDGVLFSIWDVRVKDYAAFVKETGHEWPKPDFTQTDNDPAVMVSWDDARAFCDWLTRKERAKGKLGPNQKYRLPTDAEWSVAVGLGDEDEGTPEAKSGKIQGVYPWGNHWPPRAGAGNYCGEETRSEHPDWAVIPGYNDGHVETSPVGTFHANRYGLYDMGGNVWQWCEDKYNSTQDYRVLRGGSWVFNSPVILLSSFRYGVAPGDRYGGNGFRVVLVVLR